MLHPFDKRVNIQITQKSLKRFKLCVTWSVSSQLLKSPSAASFKSFFSILLPFRISLPAFLQTQTQKRFLWFFLSLSFSLHFFTKRRKWETQPGLYFSQEPERKRGGGWYCRSLTFGSLVVPASFPSSWEHLPTTVCSNVYNSSLLLSLTSSHYLTSLELFMSTKDSL